MNIHYVYDPDHLPKLLSEKEGGQIMDIEQKFDFAALMDHKVKTRFKVTEKNKPNIDKMTEAFFQLLKK